MGTINVLSGISPIEKTSIQSPAQVAEIYSNVVMKFKLRGDVQSGKALAYKGWNAKSATFENTPKGIGDGLSTTGWCVSASSALLNDPIFQETIAYRHATAKLISIDIKEQWYGKCYNGSFNKWHTAILVQDSGYNLIVDITCSQFSGDFNEKYVWDFKTWETTFRSAYCKHDIFDSNDICLSPATASNFLPKTVNKSVASIEFAKMFDCLHNLTNIIGEERKFLSEYFIYNINVLNDKMYKNDISQLDYTYIQKLNGIFKNMPFKTLKNGVTIIEFKTKDELKCWLKKFLTNNCSLNQTLFVSNSLESSATKNNISLEEFNVCDNSINKCFIVFNFESIFGIDVSFIENSEILLPFGLQLNVDLDSIRNGGADIIKSNPASTNKETNAVFITVNV